MEVDTIDAEREKVINDREHNDANTKWFGDLTLGELETAKEVVRLALREGHCDDVVMANPTSKKQQMEANKAFEIVLDQIDSAILYTKDTDLWADTHLSDSISWFKSERT